MKKALLFSTTLAVVFCLSGFPIMAQGRGGGGMGGGGRMGMGQSGGASRGPMNEQPGMDTGMNRGRTRRTPMETRKTPSQLLQQNTRLSDNLKTMLPVGTSVKDAASGFRNLGQFVAAVHISKNLNIPFDQYKDKVTSGDSLGKALQKLDPKLSHKQVKTEVKKGKQQAKEDIKASHRS